MKKVFFLASALSIMITQTGCFGSFTLVHKVYDWNDSVTDNKFLKTLLFYGLNIIPVYGISLFIDAIIFNLIEFWDGTNPLSMESGEMEEQLMTINGKAYKVTATQNQLHFAQLVDGKRIDLGSMVYSSEAKSWGFEKDGVSQELVSINDDNSVSFNTAKGTQLVDMSSVDCVVLNDFSSNKELELAAK